jgi:hypothetical protein
MMRYNVVHAIFFLKVWNTRTFNLSQSNENVCHAEMLRMLLVHRVALLPICHHRSSSEIDLLFASFSHHCRRHISPGGMKEVEVQ